MDESEIIKIFIQFGLKRNEIIIYLDLIKKGKSSITEISKRTNIYRSNAYGALNRLIKKGFVNQIIQDKKKFFYPTNPDALFDFHKSQEEELKKIIPEIKKMQNIQNEETKVTIFQGKNAIKNIFNNLLESKNKIYIYGASKEAYETMGGFFEDFHNKRINKKIELHRIYGRDSITRMNRLNKMDYTQARYLPIQHSKITTTLNENQVIIIVWDFPIETIVIKSKHIAESYKNNFFILWQETNEAFSNTK